MKRRDAIAFGAMVVLLLGLLMPALAKNQTAAAQRRSINNLKQLGLACHTHNDTFFALPNNGGCNKDSELAEINYGWHNQNFRNSGSWITQIASWIEQEQFARDTAFKNIASTAVPAAYPDEKHWKVEIKTILCPGRGRKGLKTRHEKGCYPGPVTDYALNAFINAPPMNYNKHGFAHGEITAGVNGDWAASQSKMTIQGIQDGSSNTIMIGGKALPPAVAKQNVSADLHYVMHAPAPVVAGAAEGDGDEGIFSPGNWSLKDNKKTLVSTGTARGHIVVKDPPKENVKEYPKEGGVPWMYRDDELKDKELPPYQAAWGGPFEGGVLYCFGDGTVRPLKYTQKGTVNFARILYPNDGANATFDD